MRIRVLILATFVVGALCEEKCVPGTTFMEDCNKCRCSNDGQKACTRKMCPPNELSDDAQVRTEQTQTSEPLSSADEKDEVHLQTNGQVCTPNEIKMQECNRCRCANNGIGWFCTKRACPPREKRAVVDGSSSKCTPGTTFKSSDGCNSCFCSENGVAACTERACISGDVFGEYLNRQRRSEPVKCTPGTSFKSADGCNTCRCTDDGRAACTRRFCAPKEGDELIRVRRQSEEAPKCTPGTTFMAEDGCNTCYCDAQGRAACSLKFCASSDVSAFRSRLQHREVKESKCVPGTTYTADDGCNTCRCTDDGRAACSRRLCAPPEGAELIRFKRETPESGAKNSKCTPGTTFRDADDCNTCFCTELGTVACTRKACIKNSDLFEKLQKGDEFSTGEKVPEHRERRQVKECTPGTTFMAEDGCNTCFCDAQGRAACSLKFCPSSDVSAFRDRLQRREVKETKCVPGTTFMAEDGCNTCHCSPDGRAACTRQMCEPLEGAELIRFKRGTKEPGDIYSKCTPGTSFPDVDGCNTCYCNEQGHAFCTLIDCSDTFKYYPQEQGKPYVEASSEKAPVHRERRQVKECTPGTTFMAEDGCNTCFCDAQGRAACSLKFCPSSDVSAFRDRLQRREVKETKCVPGTTYTADDGCNTCRCTDDGRAACSRRLCAPLEGAELIRFKRETPESGAKNSKCTPGTTFKDADDCNTCFCNEQGQAACTKKKCFHKFEHHSQKLQKPHVEASSEKGPEHRERRQVKECTPGTTFMSDDGCNTCFCDSEGRAACTLMACQPNTGKTLRKRETREHECTPGTTFRDADDCNNCFCTADGRAACTQKACIKLEDLRPKRDSQQELPQSAVAPGTPGFKCTPRASFKYQCNTCLCSEDGVTAGCTFKFCVPGEY